jgi:predicted nucleic acid-binding protein
MIVVADTSPINYLILVEAINLLPKLYKRIVVPEAVGEELSHPGAPSVVREWSGRVPSWLEVRRPSASPDRALQRLDSGERDAILLAVELRAEQLLIDDREGRQLAVERGIAVMGTLGVLKRAGAMRLVDLRAVVARLQETSFYVAPAVLRELLGD